MSSPVDQLVKNRTEKLKKIKALGINPYPARCIRKHLVKEARLLIGKEVALAGRILAWRGHGKIQFLDLADGSGKIQLVFKINEIADNKLEFLKLLDSGDFMAAQGKVFKTNAGEISVLVKDFQLVSKSLRPLPDSWYGLKDIEERFRKRYIDLLLNPEIKKRFEIRSKLTGLIRQFLDSKGFLEFETPTLQPLYGGTNAKPFKTYVNSLGQDMYLRIADELYLKRLIVGGYEKVYEICKDFRNEGFDLSHQPEFTMIEYYQAYADYQDIIQLTEDLIKYCSQKIFNKTSLKVGDLEIDLSGDWEQITMKNVVKKYIDIDYEKISVKELMNLLKKNQIDIKEKESKNSLFFKVFDHFIPKYLIKPTWIIDYPQDVSPLSKAKEKQEGWVERFEGYIGGKELCDGWSEINDSLEQRARFVADKDKVDAQPVDESFIEALEYGMPPLGGIGIGIDRLTMFFTNTWSIKEIILFPLMRKIGKK